MPYNTRRKSLSLPSLGIHIPMTSAARSASAASKSSGRPSSSSSASASASPRRSASDSHSPDSHPSKRLKRSHGPDTDSVAIEQTPPPSPTPATSVEMSDVDVDVAPKKVDLEGINDDIVKAVISQLESTANRPHLIKDLATVLAQSLSSVQHSANPCAIISSRLASYMKRPCWSALAPCPLAKELETVHPRRTYYFLTTFPRQPLPESGSVQQPHLAAVITPSVSLTDDSGSEDVDERRRQLSPSPEIDLLPPDFDDVHEDNGMPATPMGSFPKYQFRDLSHLPHDLPPLEKDEREFTQTADILQKRKFNEEPTLPDLAERSAMAEYGYRDDLWFGDNASTAFLTSPAMKPSSMSHSRSKEDEADNWLKFNMLFEWDQGAESIEIDELDGLLEGC